MSAAWAWVLGILGVAIILVSIVSAWHAGRVVGERDEARRQMRYVDPEEQKKAIREAIAAGPRHGTQPPRWPQ